MFQPTIDRQSEKGFTLVELAVVMIIIGLLIGGILKGQELIGNAEIAATVSQLKGIDGATSTFRDKYDAFPGDMNDAQNRVAGAAGNGDGSGRINNLPGAAPGNPNEAALFWDHLESADVLTAEVAGAGNTIESRIQNAFIGIGFTTGAAVPGNGLGANYNAGHYLNLTGNNTGADADAIRPDQAGRIDRKIDNGDPATGNVRGSESAGGGCEDAGNAGNYDEDSGALGCSIFMRIQG